MLSKAVIFPPGAGGLPTMKLGYVFEATYPARSSEPAAQLSYSDNNYSGHAGWKEIITVGPPDRLLASSAPATDRSAELSNYPTDMLNSPPQNLTASVRLSLPGPLPRQSEAHAAIEATTRLHTGPSAAAAMPLQKKNSPLANQQLSRQALFPKTIPASRPPAVPLHAASATSTMHLQANQQGTARNAFTELVTTQHLSLWFLFTAAFISMGLGALHALEPGHGKTIVAAYLVGSKGTAQHAVLLGIIVTVAHTASVFALGAITLYASHYILPEQLYPWLGVLSGLTIAALGSYMLLRRWTGEDMEHAHAAGAMHGHWFSSKKSAHAASESCAPQQTTKAVSLGQLFALGITGGIIPCPAALVVLLSAFALHRVGFGFFLITAFSAGLAAVLISFGLMMVHARRLMARLQVDGPITRRWLPVASAAFMTLLGVVIAVRAFATTGLTAHSFSQQRLGPALFVAGLGLVLGIRHSTDPDHVVAISTIVTRERSMRGAALLGTLWGLGHTLTIFVVGCLIILCGVIIPPRVGLAMEFSVGLMLILLGVLNLTGILQTVTVRLSRNREHPAGPMAPGSSLSRLQGCRTYQWMRPLAIGLVHGLAGSAAVALLVLSTIHTAIWAVLYLVIFGAGTMLGMMCMTVAMSIPLVYAGDRLPKVSRYLGLASGLVSVCFGTFLVYQLGFVSGLFTNHPRWIPH
jgi:high-affinity nickel-transport protein